MTQRWYVAHALMVLRPQSPVSQPLYCWENLLLIQADDQDDPWELASERARKVDATNEYAQNPIYPVPAHWEFAGIRKVVSVRHDSDEGTLSAGDELTYNTFLFTEEAQIQRFLAGEECAVTYGRDIAGNAEFE